jgi:hypothetical protein
LSEETQMTADDRIAAILDLLPREEGDDLRSWRNSDGRRFSVRGHGSGGALCGETSTSGRMAKGTYHGSVTLWADDGSSTSTSDAVIIAADGTVIAAPPQWWDGGFIEATDPS